MIFETIITTQAPGGRIQITPMGAHHHHEEDEDLLVLLPFKPSTTLNNILYSRCAVLNYTDDVRVFAGALTGRNDWATVPAERVFCARLRDSLAHAELALERVEDDELRPRLVMRRVFEATHAPFRGFNRAQAAVIEAAILVSRLRMLPAEKIAREMAYLASAVEKTGGPAEREAWQWLEERIRQHRTHTTAPPPRHP
ncbi:MAG: DUF447 family protein [Betaproteobacteria bacterium]|nr:DUF447 family protein [Betaproteobacteria bacterium]